MKLRKLFLLVAGCLILFASCKPEIAPELPPETAPTTNGGSNSGSSGSGNSPAPTPQADPTIYAKKAELNPTISDNAAVSQDFIFNLDSVGFTTITIRRSEWNKMLSYYDYFYKNENNVIAESYEYTKGGKTWNLNNVGLRLRGNTSRFKPQGKDTPTDESGHTMPNGAWSTDYYNYAKECPDNTYRQSHFKVDFEPLDTDDRKMSKCMKGVALKRSDSYFSKEIFCYHLFHQYGIWTAPRASQTKVYIKIVEDVQSDGSVKENIEGCSLTKVDYGVYEMFEEVNKQSLKGRASKVNKSSTEWTDEFSDKAWKNNNGDLWKCAGGDLVSYEDYRFGVEDIRIIDTSIINDEGKTLEEKAANTIWYDPTYDLKTNKSNLDSARTNFQTFIRELNDCTTEEKCKAFYEKWFDVDLFIKTYAVNILVGMDDDYWGNHNNYYLYFDNGSNGSGKCYFIPFDYDNTLGSSIEGDKLYWNPLEWGKKESGYTQNSPLLDRLLEVPEYLEKMKATLLEVSSQDPDSPWNKNNCFAFWNKIQSQVQPYVYSADLKGWPDISSLGIDDAGGWKEHKHYLTKDSENIYEQTTVNFRYWLTDKTNLKVTFDFNGGSFNGSTEQIKKQYESGSSRLDDILGGIPFKTGCGLIGWTKTKDGNDFVTDYNGESALTVYAKWETVPTKVTAKKSNFDNIYDPVTLTVEAKSDGLHITKTYNASYPRANLKVTDLNTGKELFFLDNINQAEDSGAATPLNTFVYPYVEADHIYELKLELNNTAWNGSHDLKCKVKAVGGKGDIYISHNGYSFDFDTLTVTFNNLEMELGDLPTDIWKRQGFLFKNAVWGNMYDFYDENETKASDWCGRWEKVGENKIQYQNWFNPPEAFKFVPLGPDTREIYTATRYEYKYNEKLPGQLTYMTDIIIGKIYSIN